MSPSPPRSRRRRGGSSRWWLLGILVALAAVFWVTLRPEPAPAFPTGVNWKPLDHHGKALQALQRESADREAILYYLASDVVGNVVLFVPLGVFLAGALAGRRRRPDRHAAVRLFAATALALLVSVAIEIVQLQIPGRATDVDDVIFNAVGALVGASGLLVGERIAERRRLAR